MYKGMKWYKCDLQMQTPGDYLNWLKDDPCYLGGEPTEEEITSSVDQYLKRCHEVDLDIIGITDHNFIGRNYLQKLIERNRVIAREIGRDPLIIYPGFEIEISQGNGVHMLCLFDPSTSLQVIDDIVTTLGLPTNRRIQDGRILPANVSFDQVIRIVQEDPNHNGIVIAAHPLAESGILNDRFLPEHFQQYIFKDPRLLAIEVPSPVESLSRGWQRLLKSESDCSPDWRRQHPIATIMSSDCYSIYESDKGFIGKRFSWIRMSDNTIEALRQAMRDHQSRIILQDTNPRAEIRYGRIKSLKVENVAFLEDSTLHFSPNFNCIIGGRGAGKSSVLEYIRLCTNYEHQNDKLENLNRIKNTLNANTLLQLTWEDISGTDVFEFDLQNNQSKVLRDEDISDESTIFSKLGIQIYSQRQITNMANNTANLIPIIDQITGEEIRVLEEKENVIKDEIRIYQQDQNKLTRKLKERREINQQIIELKRQWDSFVAVKEENEKRLNAQEAKKYLHQVQNETEEFLSTWQNNVETLINNHVLLDLSEKKWQNTDFFNELDKGVLEAKQSFVKQVKNALQTFSSTINSLTNENQSCTTVLKELDNAEKEFLSACERENLKPEELEILKDVNEQKNRKQVKLDELDDEIVELYESTEKLRGLFDNLYEIWQKQTDIRNEKIHSILSSSSVPKLSLNSQPFINVNVTHMGDINNFFEHWNGIKINKATRLGRNWFEVGEVVFNKYQETDEFKSPWQYLMFIRENNENCPEEIKEFHSQLVELLNSDQNWNELVLKRIDDQIDITLFREDGTRAGSLLDNGLSDGQKNTAILTLLFADGTSPIIIDQPEDELDSDFIYNQLVPLIRNIKNKRQIIIASHNANLPVNGDAELVYALRTDMGRGILRQQGGIDKEHVREAILDIMEGSEEAFRKRQEKYYS